MGGPEYGFYRGPIFMLLPRREDQQEHILRVACFPNQWKGIFIAYKEDRPGPVCPQFIYITVGKCFLNGYSADAASKLETMVNGQKYPFRATIRKKPARPCAKNYSPAHFRWPKHTLKHGKGLYAKKLP
jgi:hypothetical protein